MVSKMFRVQLIVVIFMALVFVSACSVESSDRAEEDSGPSVAIENPFGGDDDDQIDGSGGSADANGSSDNETGGSGDGSTGGSQSTHENTDPLVFKTDALKDAVPGEVYKQKLIAEGGSGQYEWSAVSGLPANGLELKTRWIKGVPESAGSFPITIKLRDEETDETISRDFVLTVVKHLDEQLRIAVEQSDGSGAWSPVDASKDAVEFDNASRRIRLRVDRADGAAPSAERYFWSVTSPEGRLAAFVPPKAHAQSVPQFLPFQARTVFLIAWERKGTGSVAIFDIVNRKIDLSGTSISVQDDYGNKAGVTFDEIVIASGSPASGATDKKLSIKAPAEVRKNPYQSQPGDAKSQWDFTVTIENGTPPYTLEVQKTKACEELPESSRTEANYGTNNCVRDAEPQNPNWYWNCDASACWHFELELTSETNDGSQYRVSQNGGANFLQQFNSSCSHVSNVDLIARDAEGNEVTKTVPLVINFHPTEDLEYCGQ